MTPEIDCLRKTRPVLRVSTHIYGVSKEIDGKICILQSKPRHVTPQVDSSQKYEPCAKSFNTHVWGFQGDRWETMFIFQSKPMHVTPLIECLGETSPLMGVATHIYGISKEIDGEYIDFLE